MSPGAFPKGGVCLAKEAVMNLKELQETFRVGTESAVPRPTALSHSVGILLGELCLINPTHGVWLLLENPTSVWQ